MPDRRPRHASSEINMPVETHMPAESNRNFYTYIFKYTFFLFFLLIFVASMTFGATGRQVGNLVSLISIKSNIPYSTDTYYYVLLNFSYLSTLVA